MQNTGRTKIIANTENAIPAIVPIAKSNQKTSSGPSDRNGRSPRIVETIVRLMGLILREKALMYFLSAWPLVRSGSATVFAVNS